MAPEQRRSVRLIPRPERSASWTRTFSRVSRFPKGGTFSVDSNLTLVSDPGSLIQLGDLSGTHGQFPDFGSFAGGPARLPPYPSHRPWSISGPACSWSPDCGDGGVSVAIAARLGAFRVLVPVWLPWLVLFFCLLAPGLAPAGTITVNDLAQPLSASSEGFATTNFYIIGRDASANLVQGNIIGLGPDGQSYNQETRIPQTPSRSGSTFRIPHRTPSAAP